MSASESRENLPDPHQVVERLRNMATDLRVWNDDADAVLAAADLIEFLAGQRDHLNQTAGHGYDLLERALDGMNEAVRLTFTSGSSAVGMEYIGNWLNGGDAVDDGAKDDRSDHHLDEADETFAQRLQGLPVLREKVADGNAYRHGDEHLDVQDTVPGRA